MKSRLTHSAPCAAIYLAFVTALMPFGAMTIARSQAQTLQTPVQNEQHPKRLYVEERVKTTTGVSVHCDNYGNCYGGEGTRSRNVSLELTREILKKCPSAVAITDNREIADFYLRISPGSSTLYRQNGDVAYQSPAKFRVSSLAKDVCEYIGSFNSFNHGQLDLLSSPSVSATTLSASSRTDSSATTPVALPHSQTQSRSVDPALLVKAQAGDAAAERQVGLIYFSGEIVPQDYATAANWFRKAAEQGDITAQSMIGFLYDNGQGVNQDYAQALMWYRKAAEKGNDGAQLGLGMLYDNGDGVPQDYRQAAIWYRKAAEQGNAGAQYSLGVLYHNGHGLPQDYAQAATWYRKAADQGFSDAQASLGLLYLAGKGVQQDYSEAAAWYRKAAEQGNSDAQYGLGVLLKYGYGLPKDNIEAYFWLNLAAANPNGSDHAKAVESRDEVAAQLTPDELSRAQQKDAAWIATHQK